MLSQLSLAEAQPNTEHKGQMEETHRATHSRARDTTDALRTSTIIYNFQLWTIIIIKQKTTMHETRSKMLDFALDYKF